MLQRTDDLTDHELVIDRQFRAPVALVWRLWTNAELLKRWFGPKDFVCPSYSLDFRVGGTYRGLIRSEQYGDNWFGGEILEIVPLERLVMTFAWENENRPGDLNEITVTFAEAGGVTTQRFHQAPFASVEQRDSHFGGWSECLDKQVAYLASEQGS